MEILRNIFENLKNEIGNTLNEARTFYPWYQDYPYEYALNHSATGST